MGIEKSSLAVVVTADDFGIGYATSQGIIDAHRAGPVTATSVMTLTGDHVRRSIPLLEHATNLDVGLHLVFTRCGHRPLKAKPSSGLVSRDGQFHANGLLWLRALAGKLDRAAVIDEISAQADAFHALLGRPPDFVDSHHHAHQLPIIRQALVQVIQAGLLPPISRTTIEPPAVRKNVTGGNLKRRAAHQLGQRAARFFAQHRLHTNDFFIGMLTADSVQAPFPWKSYLNNLPSTGIVEWIVHPGLPDETLIARDSYCTQRPLELKFLTQSPTRELWHPLLSRLTRKSALYPNGK